jgi:hypothetical protein
MKTLGIGFFTSDGEYTGEPVWEGEKGGIHSSRRDYRFMGTAESKKEEPRMNADEKG